MNKHPNRNVQHPLQQGLWDEQYNIHGLIWCPCPHFLLTLDVCKHHSEPSLYVCKSTAITHSLNIFVLPFCIKIHKYHNMLSFISPCKPVERSMRVFSVVWAVGVRVWPQIHWINAQFVLYHTVETDVVSERLILVYFAIANIRCCFECEICFCIG